MTPEPQLADWILRAFETKLGHALIPTDISVSDRRAFLDSWNTVVLAHDTQPDPVFIYANQAALGLFGYSAREMIGMPSRFSAEAPERGERERFLRQVRERGFATDYTGIRVDADGNRFRIHDAILWNVEDDKGNRLGQAACFNAWTYLGGS